MNSPPITCLCPTYGRFSWLRRTLAYFEGFDYPNKRLVILNHHPVPIHCDRPRVTVFNEPRHVFVKELRTRLLELCPTKIAANMDDDDGYMPWHLSDAVSSIGDADAWKPRNAWTCLESPNPGMSSNIMEASWVYQVAAVRGVSLDLRADEDEHPGWIETIHRGKLVETDSGFLTSFAHGWANGVHHLSGSYGQRKNPERMERYRENNRDHGAEVPLTPADLSPVREAVVRAATSRFGEEAAAELSRRLEVWKTTGS